MDQQRKIVVTGIAAEDNVLIDNRADRIGQDTCCGYGEQQMVVVYEQGAYSQP